MKKLLLLTLFVLISCSCSETKKEPMEMKQSAPEAGKSEYLVAATLWAQKSAEYDSLCFQAYNVAKDRLQEALKKQKKGAKKLAIILDIDETVLNNTPFQGTVIKEGIVFDQALWTEWVKLENAKALAGAQEFLTFANEKKVEIFYVSNRDASLELIPTYNNLLKEKIPVKKENLLFKDSKSSSKEPRRQKISEKYEVVLLFGDNLIDFAEGFEGNDEKRNANVGNHRTDWGKKFIVFPNPMYGDWIKPFLKEKKYFRELIMPMK